MAWQVDSPTVRFLCKYFLRLKLYGKLVLYNANIYIAPYNCIIIFFCVAFLVARA